MINYVSGLPRSGSTLLVNLLAQNPAHFCTATNSLSDLVGLMRVNWQSLEGFRSQGLSQVAPLICSAMNGMILGFHQNPLKDGKIVFDKSRGWPQMIEVVEKALGTPMKIIVLVRDVRSVVASFELLRRSVPFTAPQAALSLTERVNNLLDTTMGSVGSAITVLMDAIDRGYKDRLIIVPYHALTFNPKKSLAKIHSYLGLPEFDYDVNNVKHTVKENDDVWGLPLHRIRSVVTADVDNRWQFVLTNDIAMELDKRFSDIQTLSCLPEVVSGSEIK